MDVLTKKTGIEALDRDTGGVPAGRHFLVSGGARTGKTVFAARYLMEGISSGENVLLLTSEEPESFLNLCGELEMDLGQPLRKGRFLLLKYLFQSEDIIKGEKELSVMLGQLQDFLISNSVRRAAFDSTVPMMRFINPEWLEQGIDIILNGIDNLGVTLMLTTRMPVTSKSLEMRKKLESGSFASIHLDELSKESGQTLRKMTVRAFENLEPPYPAYEFEIVKGKGIVVTRRSETGLDSPREQVLAKSKKKGLSFSEEYRPASGPHGGDPPAPGAG